MKIAKKRARPDRFERSVRFRPDDFRRLQAITDKMRSDEAYSLVEISDATAIRVAIRHWHAAYVERANG